MKSLLLPIVALGGLGLGVYAYTQSQKKPSGGSVNVTLPPGAAPNFNPNAIATQLPPDFTLNPVYANSLRGLTYTAGAGDALAREMRRRAFVAAARRHLRGG